MYTANSHERYARAFVQQRVREVFDILDSKGDGQLDEEELLSHLWSVGYQASKLEVHDMVWEVDDRSTGVIKLEQIRTVLKRLQKSKKRMPGTGTNLLRTLIEFMMFDSDGSAAIELEEIQQMFYVYYGYKGRELDDKVNSFSRLRKKDGEIDFSEFLQLMDEIGLTPVIGEGEQVKKERKNTIPKMRRTRRPRRAHADDETVDMGSMDPSGYTAESSYPSGSQTARHSSPKRCGLPPLVSPRQKQTQAMLSEQKYRKIAGRLTCELADDARKKKEQEEANKEETGFTIRNALMKN